MYRRARHIAVKGIIRDLRLGLNTEVVQILAELFIESDLYCFRDLFGCRIRKNSLLDWLGWV